MQAIAMQGRLPQCRLGKNDGRGCYVNERSPGQELESSDETSCMTGTSALVFRRPLEGTQLPLQQCPCGTTPCSICLAVFEANYTPVKPNQSKNTNPQDGLSLRETHHDRARSGSTF